MNSAYKPSELLALLQAHSTTAKKRFSQNFLIDHNILKKIITAAQVKDKDIVLEIGAGPGGLTEILLDQGAEVIAIEVDPKLVSILSRLTQKTAALHILQSDVLTLSLEDLCREKARQGKKIKVVANLPYHITTPILTRLLPLHLWIESVTVMVQKEFAERMAGRCGTTAYGSFTLFVEYYSSPKLCFTVSPSCFYPAPKVYSAVVTCTLHPPALGEELSPAFFKMTRTAFQQRRKMLRNSLKALYSLEVLDQAMQQLGIEAKVRPEELSLSQFLSLFRMLEK